MKMKVKIDGMTCDNCKKTVTRLISEIDGIRDVNVDLESGFAEVDAAFPIPKHRFEESLEDTAYTVTEIES